MCLTMIVKNEARIIERCLDAARFAVGSVCITDTGSADKTVQLIEAWGKKHAVPTKVHTAEWKNFGHNRTVALANAHASFPEAPYLLLLDADMCLVDKGFSIDQLTKDGGMLYQTEGGTTYRNLRIVKNDRLWKSMGVTHEYTSPADDKPAEIVNCDTLVIDDRSDGGSKDDKLDRDALLLLQGLKDEPGNSRYMFYLGNTYYAMNQCLDAIYWYERRLADKKNGFEEEAWYTTYRTAQCYEKMEDWPRAVYWFMKAINRRPHRLEPYVALAKIYIFKDPPHNYYTATTLIKAGMAEARPEQDLLFVEDSAYEYDCWYCLSLSYYYLGKKLEGRVACDKVIQCPKTPAQLRAHVQNMRAQFYA